jgi:menaquinone-dependent protoporphyrinogen IX oxidase
VEISSKSIEIVCDKHHLPSSAYALEYVLITMNTLILYKTKNQSTRDYAEYLHYKIKDSEIANIDTFNIKRVVHFDKIIIGSATYIGQIIALDFLIQNWEALSSKNIFVFTVGMIDPENEQSKATYETIPENIRKQIKYIKLPGRIQNNKLSFFQKLIVKVVKAPMIDKVDMKKVEPILEFAKN